jgi:hypothetical protein
VRIRNFTSLAALTAVLSIALAMPAFAQEVGEDPYQGPAAQQQQGVGGEVESSPEASESGTAPQAATVEASDSSALPFTGFEIGLAAALGIALLGVGFLLRRAGRADAGS